MTNTILCSTIQTARDIKNQIETRSQNRKNYKENHNWDGKGQAGRVRNQAREADKGKADGSEEGELAESLGKSPSLMSKSETLKGDKEMRKLTSGGYFRNTRPNPTANVIRDGGFWFIEDVQSGIATDEYGNQDVGFICNARPASESEISAWKEARRAARGNRSVWQMIENHTTE